MRYWVIGLFVILIPQVRASQEGCVAGGGTWIVPLTDALENDLRVPFCQCEQGYEWNGTCKPIPEKVLCESSDGVWTDSCSCPEGSEWNKNIGCDKRMTSRNLPILTTTILIVLTLVILALSIGVYFIKRRYEK